MKSKNEQSFKKQTSRISTKKIIFLFSGLFCSLILFSQNQASIESLKQENTKLIEQISNLKQDTVYLRKVISTCDLLKKSGNYMLSNSNSGIKIEILSCTGDRASQTVTVEFMISHQFPHQRIYFNVGKGANTAYDNLGNTFQIKGIDFQDSFKSVSTIEVVVPTDIRIKGSISYNNVLPATEQFSLIQFSYDNQNQDDYPRGTRTKNKVEIRNIPIVW